MKHHILQIGNPVLRQIAQELSITDILSASTRELIDLMKNIMWEAPGVGLAAPQIGKSLQIVTIEDKADYTRGISAEQLAERKRRAVPFHILINPKIINKSDEQAEFFEACLSGNRLIGLVKRALRVQVKGLNEKAEPVIIDAEGWYARILQHEIDHLNGILCIDHMCPRSMSTLENYTHYWKFKSVQEVQKELNC